MCTPSTITREPRKIAADQQRLNEHQAKRETFKGEDVFDRAQRPRQQD
mgnify:CR=1 FL=1